MAIALRERGQHEPAAHAPARSEISEPAEVFAESDRGAPGRPTRTRSPLCSRSPRTRHAADEWATAGTASQCAAGSQSDADELNLVALGGQRIWVTSKTVAAGKYTGTAIPAVAAR